MTGETIVVCFGGGSGPAGDWAALQQGGARRAFAGLFAATASLTGAAMTARTVTRAAASQEYNRTARGSRVGICSAGCRIAHESRNDFRTGGPERRETRRRIDIGRVYALPTRMRISQQTLPEVLSGENGESVADVYLQAVREQGVGAE